MFGLFDWLKIGSGAVAGALLASAPVYLYGKAEGRQQASVAALERTVELIHSRELTNAEISSSDAADLCGHFGLPDDDAEQCVRRIREASAKP